MFSDGARTLRDHRIERGPGRFGNIVTPLEMQQEHLLQRASRSEIRSFVYIEIRSFVYICIAAGEVVQDPTLLPGPVGPLQIGASTSGGQPEGCLAVRALAGHASRTGVEGSAHSDHGALLSPATFSVRRGPGRGEDFEGTP
jgi:hypothetical protein